MRKICLIKAIGMTTLSLTLLVTSVTSLGLAQERKAAIRFAGSSIGGTFYICVGGFAPFASKHIEGLTVTPVTSQGSVENCRAVAKRRVDMGLATSGTVYDAYHSKGIFEGENNKDIRGIAVLGASGQHWVTLKESGIKTLWDLRGKRVAIGPPGSASADMAEITLEVMGIKDDVEIRRIGYSDAAMALKDRNLDAFATCGRNVACIIEVASTHPIRLLPVPDEIIEKVTEESPGYLPFVVEANTYEGVDYPVKIIGYAPIWIVHKDVAPWIVYEMVKLAYSKEGREYLSTVHAQWKYAISNVDLIKQIRVPLHEGAVKYWKEVGEY